MPVSFSIKNVPDELAEALRRRAELNHRSLQGELMAILDAAIGGGRSEASEVHEAPAAWNVSSAERDQDASEARVVPPRVVTISDLYEYVQSLPITSVSESTEFIRKDRDEH